MEFHERLYDLRKKKSMTQDDLAEALHISRQSISRWENGDCEPDLSNLRELANIFEVSMDYLIRGTTVQQPIYVVEKKRSSTLYEDIKRNWTKYNVTQAILILLTILCAVGVIVISIVNKDFYWRLPQTGEFVYGFIAYLLIPTITWVKFLLALMFALILTSIVLKIIKTKNRRKNNE